MNAQANLSRIGLIVPSSNTTMETELPELFRRQTAATGHHYTFHATRAVMKQVTQDELRAMVEKAADCATTVSDAHVDAITYACLVAVMAQGAGAHKHSEQIIGDAARDNGNPAAVVSSAGALVRTCTALGASRIAMVTPYMTPLMQMVRDYLEAEGITVVDAVALEVPDNLAVGRLDPRQLPEIARGLQRDGAQALVLSACVQMPSLAAVAGVEHELGLPVITAATATVYETLTSLGHVPAITGAGTLLEPPTGGHHQSQDAEASAHSRTG